MTEETNKPVQRHDRDLDRVQDAHDEKLRRLKAHLTRPIQAREADDPIRLNTSALREHARLADLEEHPRTRHLREKRGL